jgi:hypothetical protein
VKEPCRTHFARRLEAVPDSKTSSCRFVPSHDYDHRRGAHKRFRLFTSTLSCDRSGRGWGAGELENRPVQGDPGHPLARLAYQVPDRGDPEIPGTQGKTGRRGTYTCSCPSLQLDPEDLGPSTNAAISRRSPLYLFPCLCRRVRDFSERAIRRTPAQAHGGHRFRIHCNTVGITAGEPRGRFAGAGVAIRD